MRPGTGTATRETRPGSSSTLPGATTSPSGTEAVAAGATFMRLSWGWPAGNITRFPLRTAADRLGSEAARLADGGLWQAASMHTSARANRNEVCGFTDG